MNCTIVEGDPHWLVGGKPVVLKGQMVSCGATLISTMPKWDARMKGAMLHCRWPRPVGICDDCCGKAS
ncbi:PAAR domain-containing protein [Chromobacterium haemolyticum]|uniref:PAAR domain-containing protein n=1 Tax=Chromobacterium haemolyticum TaxID=394935 RepID=UPI001E46B979|nr:PAAR domain-containing protein [Chromobacterium haemolyticum]